jgi:hypothetical protein
MKRTIEFQALDDKYLFMENGIDIFVIDKSSRQLDVKSFYEAFFANGKDFSEIEIIHSELNKDDERIYNAISKLITDICTRLKTELPTHIDSREDLQSYIMSDHS